LTPKSRPSGTRTTDRPRGRTETSQGGTETSQFEGVLTAGVMVLADIAPLVFMVGLAYAVAVGPVTE